MKVELVSTGSYERTLQISVPADVVNQEVDVAYRHLKTQVRLRGFRPGKAPRRVLEARFGAQVQSDVASTLIQRGYTQALEQHEIEPVSRPRVDQGDLNVGLDFEFSIVVEVRPEVELENYTGLEVVFPKSEVTDQEVDEAVQSQLAGQARLVEVKDRAVGPADMAMIELLVSENGETLVTEPGTMVRMEADPYYPGLETLILGMAVDEEKAGKVAFDEGARAEAVAGKELDVSVKVLSIQTHQVPDLSDEVAEELGYEGGVEKMRSALAAELESGREQMMRNQARANLLQALIAANPFDVPAGMVDQQLQVLMEELKMQQAYRGVDPRTIHFSDAQVADLRMRSQFAVKGGLILDHVSQKEGIEVTEEDIEAKYQSLADERGQSIEAIRGYFAKENAVEELRARLEEERTLDWLLERSVLVDAVSEPEAEEEPAKKAAPKKKAAAKKKAAPKKKAAANEAEAEAATDGPDLSFLGGSVSAVKEALETGAHDGHLEALLAAEEAGKARKGALAAIKKRMS